MPTGRASKNRLAMHIRDARPDDWGPISALLAVLGRPDVRGREDEEDHRQAFAAYLRRPDTEAIVAEDEGEVVGFVDVEYRRRLNFLSPQAWIADLVVDERSRGRGVGRALLAAAEERARTAGCFSISLESANWRSDSHAFYERVGWRESSKSFTRNLTGERWPPPPPGEE